MKLSAKAEFGFDGEPVMVLVEDDFGGRNISEVGKGPIAIHVGQRRANVQGAWACLPEDLNYVSPGDILRLNPTSGSVRVLYRRASSHNVLFVTNRCNSRCVMCSQPPTEADDGYLVDDILRMIPWMSKATKELGITGGEPALLGAGLIEVIAAARTHLPETALHMLSNGRLFSEHLARRIGELQHQELMIGVPLYSDVAADHDFVVQAHGAFGETIEGLLNLASAGIRIEVRVVIHRYTHNRLPQLAKFIARNLPFVEQVAFMGLEPIGFARTNLRALWIHPDEFMVPLTAAIGPLEDARIRPVVYNVPLCAVPSVLRRYSRRAISDWKNIFSPECGECVEQPNCGGFFSWVDDLPESLRFAPMPVRCADRAN